MKKTILMVLVWLSAIIAYAQSPVVVQDEVIVLDTDLEETVDYQFFAGDSIVLSPGFRRLSHIFPHHVFNTELVVDDYAIFPPSQGEQGGPNEGDQGYVGALGGSVDVGAIGGATYSIPIELPAGINNLRLGESFILGNETAYSQRIPGTYNDAVTLRAQIIELKHKPSLPIGDVGVDAFGQVPSYEDRGWIDRAIFAVGKQDMNPDGLTPLNTKADVLGASSDHLIMDVTKENYKLGDTVDFSLDSGALLKLFTSAYIERAYI